MIKQPIIATLLNSPMASSEVSQSSEEGRQSLPKVANAEQPSGFAALFASAIPNKKTDNLPLSQLKGSLSDIHISPEKLDKIAELNLGLEASDEFDIEAILKQINQAASVSAQPEVSPESQSVVMPSMGLNQDKLMTNLTQTNSAEKVNLESLENAALIEGHAAVVDKASLKLEPVLTSTDIHQSLKSDLKSPVAVDTASHKAAMDASLPLATSADQHNDTQGSDLKSTMAAIDSSSPKAVIDVPVPPATTTSVQQVSIEVPISGSGSGSASASVSGEIKTVEKDLTQIVDASVDKRSQTSPAVEASREQQVLEQATKLSDINAENAKAVQQGNDVQQQVQTVQSNGQAQSATVQQPQGGTAQAGAQTPSTPGANTTSQQQPSFEQGSGQQGQSSQSQQHSAQQNAQQAQAFAQMQKQETVRVQQEGVRSFNDAIVSEEAKAEKAEKLIGNLGFDSRNQLPPGLQTLSQPPRSPQWGQALGQRITYMANNKVQEAKITLNPEKLGTIQIKLNIDKDNQLHVSMTTQQGTTREAIENAMPRLREILDAAGIGFGSLDVKDESAFAKEQNQGELEGRDRHGLHNEDPDGAEDDITNQATTELASDHLVDYYA